MVWDPAQYLKFAAPRLRPAADLLARVPLDAPRDVVDLGCGAGNVTRLLHERWPHASITGVDDSAAMLASARAALPRLRWVERGIADWTPDAPPDLLWSNAALHWLPDHATLFPRLARALAPGGVLAVQMPRNFEAPSHALVGETVRSGPWRARLEPLLAPPPVAAPAAYLDALAPFAAELDVWETEYLQLLDGEDPVKEFTKGTFLRPFLDAIADEAERAAFEADYAARLRVAYPRRADGRTPFPFRRLFLVMRRA
ncbi:MAG TPA: methyltransferase domain-containing protein [Burkholderiaceae bacterium]|nr:methyltransferase domain-containing protein [Burkholderiaceae bacterium]